MYYQALADGNGRDDVLNPGAFVINEVHRFIETYSKPGMQVEEIKRMIERTNRQCVILSPFKA